MRVLFLGQGAAPDHLGGADLSLISLIDHWAGVEPSLAPLVVSPSGRSEFARELDRRGWEHVPLRFGGWAYMGPRRGRAEARLAAHHDTLAVRTITELISSRHVDLVVTNTLVAPWAALAAASVGVPHVWFVREFGRATEGWRYAASPSATWRALGELSVRVVANSRVLRDALSADIDPGKIDIFPPILDAQMIERLAREEIASPWTGIEPDLRVSIVGRLTASKGQRHVVDAVALAARQGVTVAACFVGAAVAWQSDSALMRRAARLGVSDRIVWVGEQRNPHPFVRSSDVAVVASLETFGRVTFEAHALGKPVVGYASGGTVDIVEDGETGLLVRPGSVEQLASRLVTYARDRELRRAHGEAARVRARDLLALWRPHQVVDVLAAAARTSVPYRALDDFDLWLLRESLAPAEVARLERRVRAGRLFRRAGHVARHPFAAARRWASRLTTASR